MIIKNIIIVTDCKDVAANELKAVILRDVKN